MFFYIYISIIIIMFYVVSFIIYYYYFSFHRTFIFVYSRTKMERIIKKKVYIFKLIYFLYVEIKIHESKFYQTTLFLCIHFV